MSESRRDDGEADRPRPKKESLGKLDVAFTTTSQREDARLVALVLMPVVVVLLAVGLFLAGPPWRVYLFILATVLAGVSVLGVLIGHFGSDARDRIEFRELGMRVRMGKSVKVVRWDEVHAVQYQSYHNSDNGVGTTQYEAHIYAKKHVHLTTNFSATSGAA